MTNSQKTPQTRAKRSAKVAPIFKKGYKSKPSNYRPVSLTSICCKIVEHILHSHIMKFFEGHHILPDFQHGFRKNRLCESQLIITINDLARGLDNSQQIDGIRLDFSKAFNKVPHRRLAAKLHHYGVRGKTLYCYAIKIQDRRHFHDFIITVQQPVLHCLGQNN